MKWFGPGYANEMVSRKLWKEPELCNFVFNFLYVFKKCIYKAVKCTNVQSFTSFQHLIFYNFSSDMENIRGEENYRFFTNFPLLKFFFQVKRSFTNIKCDYAVLTFYFLSKFQQNRANVRVRTENQSGTVSTRKMPVENKEDLDLSENSNDHETKKFCNVYILHFN